MLHRIIVAFVCTATICAAADAWGQGRRRGFGQRGPGNVTPLALLAVQEVQQELSLTDDQRAAIDELQQDRPRRRRGRREDGREPPTEEQRAARQEAMAARAQETNEKLATILEIDQLKRLEEIVIRAQGPRALLDPKVAEKVGLGEEQVESLRESLAESMSTMRDKLRALRETGDREQMRAQMGELRAATFDKILSQLSTEQRDKFAELQGEAFELPRGALRGRREGIGRRFRDRPERAQRPPRPAE